MKGLTRYKDVRLSDSLLRETAGRGLAEDLRAGDVSLRTPVMNTRLDAGLVTTHLTPGLSATIFGTPQGLAGRRGVSGSNRPAGTAPARGLFGGLMAYLGEMVRNMVLIPAQIFASSVVTWDRGGGDDEIEVFEVPLDTSDDPGEGADNVVRLPSSNGTGGGSPVDDLPPLILSVYQYSFPYRAEVDRRTGMVKRFISESDKSSPAHSWNERIQAGTMAAYFDETGHLVTRAIEDPQESLEQYHSKVVRTEGRFKLDDFMYLTLTALIDPQTGNAVKFLPKESGSEIERGELKVQGTNEELTAIAATMGRYGIEAGMGGWADNPWLTISVEGLNRALSMGYFVPHITEHGEFKATIPEVGFVRPAFLEYKVPEKLPAKLTLGSTASDLILPLEAIVDTESGMVSEVTSDIYLPKVFKNEEVIVKVLRPFISAGVAVKYEGQVYNRRAGSILIKKDDINAALRSGQMRGRLRLKLQPNNTAVAYSREEQPEESRTSEHTIATRAGIYFSGPRLTVSTRAEFLLNTFTGELQFMKDIEYMDRGRNGEFLPPTDEMMEIVYKLRWMGLEVKVMPGGFVIRAASLSAAMRSGKVSIGFSPLGVLEIRDNKDSMPQGEELERLKGTNRGLQNVPGGSVGTPTSNKAGGTVEISGLKEAFDGTDFEEFFGLLLRNNPFDFSKQDKQPPVPTSVLLLRNNPFGFSKMNRVQGYEPPYALRELIDFGDGRKLLASFVYDPDLRQVIHFLEDVQVEASHSELVRTLLELGFRKEVLNDAISDRRLVIFKDEEGKFHVKKEEGK